MTDKDDGLQGPLTLHAHAGTWAIQSRWETLRNISEEETDGLGYQTTSMNQVARAQMSGPITISAPSRDRHGLDVGNGRVIALPVKRNQSE